jgi:hypothetical protein
MEVKFYWRDIVGEGFISQADRKRLLETHWILAADFLSDVIADASALYNEVLEKHEGTN